MTTRWDEKLERFVSDPKGARAQEREELQQAEITAELLGAAEEALRFIRATAEQDETPSKERAFTRRRLKVAIEKAGGEAA